MIILSTSFMIPILFLWLLQLLSMKDVRKGIKVYTSNTLQKLNNRLADLRKAREQRERGRAEYSYYIDDDKVELVSNKPYEDAVRVDKEAWRVIIEDINPNFYDDFEIVEKPKPHMDAEYFRNKKNEYVNDMRPEWKKQGREMCSIIVDEIAECVKDDPEVTYYILKSRNAYQENDHTYAGLHQEARSECVRYLKELGFSIDEHWFSGTMISWE